MPNIRSQFDQPQLRRQKPPLEQLSQPASVDVEQIRKILGDNAEGFQEKFQDPATKEMEEWIEEWLNNFNAQIQTGEQQSDHTNRRFEEFIAGKPLPKFVHSIVNRALGKSELVKSRPYKLQDQPYNLVGISKSLGCTRKEATNLVAFSVLLDDRYDLNAMFNRPESIKKYNPDLDIDAIQKYFISMHRVDKLISTSLKRAIPVLNEHASIHGVHELWRKLTFRNQFQEKNSEIIKASFANKKWKQEYTDYLSNPDEEISSRVAMCNSYEFLFGELTKDEFLEFFPNWREIDKFRGRKYIQRYLLDTTYDVPKWELRKEKVELPPRPIKPIPATDLVIDDATAVTPKPTEPSLPKQPGSKEPMRLNLLTPPELQALDRRQKRALQKAIKRGILGAVIGTTLLGAAAVGTFAYRLAGKQREQERIENVEKTEKAKNQIKARMAQLDRAEELKGKHTFIPDIEQSATTNAHNLNPDRKIGTAPEIKNYYSAPHFNSHRATEIFTTVNPDNPGESKYNPDFAFIPQPEKINTSNSTTYTIGERVYAQGIILYPPELGKVDPSSIYVPDHKSDEFSIEEGEGGRFRVTLNEPSAKPLIVIYQVQKVRDGFDIPYNAELPPAPEEKPQTEKARSNVFGIERLPDEDEYNFAIRAKHILRSEYRYPATRAEKQLSYEDATTQLIGDCDVVNTDLLKIYNENGIRAELIIDDNPVPGREKHGLVRALLFSQEHGGYVVVSLDATPYKRTSAGRQESSRGQSSSSGSSTSSHEPNPLTEELKEAVQDYDQNQEARLEEQKTLLMIDEEMDPNKELELPRSMTVEIPKEERIEREITDKEWNALAGGLYGYAEYKLAQAGRLPSEKNQRIRLTSEIMHLIIDGLALDGIIEPGEDPYEWSKKIDKARAIQIVSSEKLDYWLNSTYGL
ncbi:MAG: hypothetical protein ABID45_02065 [Patescibacteria group bacterium]